MPIMQRLILHIDFDSFFASVEQQLHPEFRGRPLGVTATNGRNCIIASSREAKKLGIGTGSRVHEARLLCPGIALTPANFTHYWEISKKFIKICRDFSPYVEVFSIDELFMDVTLTAHLFGGVERMIAQMKTRIRDEIGEYITVSVGISHNKLLAKLGSGLKKPNGVCIIPKTHIETIYRVAKLTDICGIGNRIAARLHMMGIYNLMTLRKTPLESLIAEFGHVEGTFLYNVGQGVDDSEIIPYTNEQEVKSVSRNYCLPQNEYDKRIVLQNIYELAEEVALKLRRLKMKARTGGVFLRGDYNLGGHLSHASYFNSGAELFSVCAAIILQSCHPEFISGSQQAEMLKRVQHDTIHSLTFLQHDANFKGYVRQLSVWAGNLQSEYALPLPLFEEEKRKEKLVKITDEINERFGDHTIRNGFLLYAEKLTTVPNGYMADRYERAKLTRFAL
jgi:DNA polymerase-4